MDEDLLAFINSTIRSVWALETLLFLRKHRDRAWTRAQLAHELRSNGTLVGRLLDDFDSAGLLSRLGEDFTFSPATAALEARCARLDAAFREGPVVVINAIASARTESVQGAGNNQ
jgi:DNA-binding IclR family transcriptional regulator